MERRVDSIRRSRARKLVIGGVIVLVIAAVSIPAVVLGQGASPPPSQADLQIPRPPVPPHDPTAHLRLPTPRLRSRPTRSLGKRERSWTRA
jgi:hypothetical protein